MKKFCLFAFLAVLVSGCMAQDAAHAGGSVQSVVVRDIEDCQYINELGGASVCEFFHPGGIDQSLGVNYSIAYVTVMPGLWIRPHRMANPEVDYVLEGEGVIYVDYVPFVLKEGRLVYIPAGAVQYIENNGTSELRFFAVNQPAWASENQEVV